VPRFYDHVRINAGILQLAVYEQETYAIRLPDGKARE
jgi:hypothetical protein